MSASMRQRYGFCIDDVRDPFLLVCRLYCVLLCGLIVCTRIAFHVGRAKATGRNGVEALRRLSKLWSFLPRDEEVFSPPSVFQ